MQIKAIWYMGQFFYLSGPGCCSHWDSRKTPSLKGYCSIRWESAQKFRKLFFFSLFSVVLHTFRFLPRCSKGQVLTKKTPHKIRWHISSREIFPEYSLPIPILQLEIRHRLSIPHCPIGKLHEKTFWRLTEYPQSLFKEVSKWILTPHFSYWYTYEI